MRISCRLFLLLGSSYTARAFLRENSESSNPNENTVERALNLPDQPTNWVDLISMVILWVGGTSIRIELENRATEPIAILTWNTFLEEFPVLEPEIKVVRQAEVQGRSTERVVREVQAIDNRVRARYWLRVFPEHFLVLTPQQTYSKTLNLQNLFHLGDTCQVLRDKCVYSLKLKQRFQIISGDGIDLGAISMSDVLQLPDVLLSSRKIYLDLCYSTPLRGLSKRGTQCDAEQAATTNRAHIAAKSWRALQGGTLTKNCGGSTLMVLTRCRA